MDIFKSLLPFGCKHPRTPITSYLEQLAFDGESFKDYPTRIGFTVSEIGLLKLETGPRYREHTALLQAWLYFGLLTIILSRAEISVDTQTLLCEESDGSKSISCSAVAHLIDVWDAYVDVAHREADWELHAQFYEWTLGIALRNARCHDFDHPQSNQSSASQQRAVVILSIRALI